MARRTPPPEGIARRQTLVTVAPAGGLQGSVGDAQRTPAPTSSIVKWKLHFDGFIRRGAWQCAREARPCVDRRMVVGARRSRPRAESRGAAWDAVGEFINAVTNTCKGGIYCRPGAGINPARTISRSDRQQHSRRRPTVELFAAYYLNLLLTRCREAYSDSFPGYAATACCKIFCAAPRSFAFSKAEAAIIQSSGDRVGPSMHFLK